VFHGNATICAPLACDPPAGARREHGENAVTETFDSINRWQRETFPDATLTGVEEHIHEEFKEFTVARSVADSVVEAVDLILLLSCYIDKATGGDGAQRHVDAKMAIDRARQWNIQADGTGRHK
jgi:Protein of unknown function (DUF550)